MKEKRIFVCEICGTDYADKENAKNCESGHKTKLTIKNMKYVAMSRNGSGFPVTIDIMSEDGTVKKYKA